jgi:hypothetical protein
MRQPEFVDFSTSLSCTLDLLHPNLTKYKHTNHTTLHPSKYTYKNTMMKFNFLFLSAAALVNGATAAATPVDLRSAGNYAILAQTGISTVPASSIIGNIAVSPIAATAITGFSLSQTAGEDWSTCTQVTGQAFAPEYSNTVETLLTTAVGDMQTAYGDAAGRAADANTDDQTFNELKGGLIGGETLTPGVYTFTTDILITADVTLHGNADDVFIIRTTGSLKQAASTQVILENGALAENVFWQVANQVAVGTSAVLHGILLVKNDALFHHSSILNGRVLAQTACNLDHATIVEV